MDLRATFAVAKDPLAEAVRALDVAALPTPAKAPPRPSLAQAKRALTMTAPLPSAPGAYAVSLAFKERRFGRQVASVGDIPVFVPGDRRASIRHRCSQPGPGRRTAL